MSILIDTLIDTRHFYEKRKIGCFWYMAKDSRYWSWENVKDAFSVLIGKSRSYHFKEDEKETK